ncbi:hypothetical protein [Aeromicrobium sp. 9AM]|uniref:hypothetical protein n=1 Tax=Aeromicrobium sp. 9AM TaxID=2653126 RepID=UPI0012F0F638|nr:hypothetical protein [Aeromicrobium sp. 9AM]VXB25132.1 conserved exported hypothetical protein [Aeromicrobium sp. 9AM]
MNVPTRRLVVALPVVLTVVIAIAIGALVVVQDQRQSAQVSEAETVAQDYLANVAKFRSSVIAKVEAADAGDPGALSKVVDRAIARPPHLGDAPAYGREHSTSYAEAAQTEATVLRPFRRLSATLREADDALAFIEAARKVLELRATDYVGYGFITTSARVRAELIPAFVRARDEFDRAPVPKGKAELAKKVHDAAQYVIDQATLLAERIENRQNFSFSYREEFQAVADAVSDYATQVKGDIAEAVAGVTADA